MAPVPARLTTTQRGYGWEFQRLRPVVLDRDGHRCQVRLPGCKGEATCVDHIQSPGPNRLDNLRAACSWCNAKRAIAKRVQRYTEGGRASPPPSPAPALPSSSVTW